MRIDIVTILPDLFAPFTQVGVCGRAIADGRVSLHLWNPRDYAPPPHRVVDDRPYGGGSGMVLMAPPLMAAVQALRQENPNGAGIYLTPRGELFNDAMARELARQPGLVLLCGRYRGIDERAVELFGGREISVGDYVLSGGEPAAWVLLDAVLRHVPGVLGNAASPDEEAFADGLLDAPNYTRPPLFAGKAVPPVLLSGNHAQVAKWRRQQALNMTEKQRPELINKSGR